MFRTSFHFLGSRRSSSTHSILLFNSIKVYHVYWPHKATKNDSQTINDEFNAFTQTHPIKLPFSMSISLLKTNKMTQEDYKIKFRCHRQASIF